MTALTKPVTRTARLIRGAIHLTLDPAGILWFREHGRRKRYPVNLNVLFARAVAAEVDGQRSRRKRRPR